MRSDKDDKGFTLIELLVVISIIGVLSTIAMTSLNGVRIKARNAKKQVDFENINRALNVFHATYNRMPRNYNPGSGACESTSNTYYDQSMQELVDVGLLAEIPRSPDNRKYCYYNYGPNSSAGAIMVTSLANIPATTIGLPGSCRPFTNNWCSSTIASSYHCICAPY